MEARRKGMGAMKEERRAQATFSRRARARNREVFAGEGENNEETENEVPRWEKKNGGQGPPLGALAEEWGAPRYGMRSWRPMTRLLSSPRTSRLATRISAQRPGLP